MDKIAILFKCSPIFVLCVCAVNARTASNITVLNFKHGIGFIEYTCEAYLKTRDLLSWYQKKNNEREPILLQRKQHTGNSLSKVQLNLTWTLTPSDKDSHIYCVKETISPEGELMIEGNSSIKTPIGLTDNYTFISTECNITTVIPGTNPLYYNDTAMLPFICYGTNIVDGRELTWYIQDRNSNSVTLAKDQSFIEGQQNLTMKENNLILRMDDTYHGKELFCAQDFHLPIVLNEAGAVKLNRYRELARSNKTLLLMNKKEPVDSDILESVPEETQNIETENETQGKDKDNNQATNEPKEVTQTNGNSFNAKSKKEDDTVKQYSNKGRQDIDSDFKIQDSFFIKRHLANKEEMDRYKKVKLVETVTEEKVTAEEDKYPVVVLVLVAVVLVLLIIAAVWFWRRRPSHQLVAEKNDDNENDYKVCSPATQKLDPKHANATDNNIPAVNPQVPTEVTYTALDFATSRNKKPELKKDDKNTPEVTYASLALPISTSGKTSEQPKKDDKATHEPTYAALAFTPSSGDTPRFQMDQSSPYAVVIAAPTHLELRGVKQ